MRYFGVGAADGHDTQWDTHRHDHNGYVSGRYRDGSRSDGWTDVLRCAPGTHVRYLPACTCGWTGRDQPATPAGWETCRRACAEEHLATHRRPASACPTSDVRPPRPGPAGVTSQGARPGTSINGH